MGSFSHYSPSELLELYPKAKILGWTPTKIGIFFRSGLLVGFVSGKENKALILEESFIKLMKYVSEVNRDRDILN
jgi:hypothetical protein